MRVSQIWNLAIVLQLTCAEGCVRLPMKFVVVFSSLFRSFTLVHVGHVVLFRCTTFSCLTDDQDSAIPRSCLV